MRRLARASMVASVALAGCDPLSFLDVQPVRTERETREMRGEVDLPRVTALVDIRRADVFAVVSDGRTQEVHLVGICAPAAGAGRYNQWYAQYTGLRVGELPRYGREAIELVRGYVASGEWRVATFGVTTNRGMTRMAVDLVNERNESLSALLLERGYAMRYGQAPRSVIDYEALEDAARQEERGMWRHPLPLERRVRVESFFTRETAVRGRDEVYQQRTSRTGALSRDNEKVVLERHDQVEERGVITLAIQVEPPLTRTYELAARYVFFVSEEQGVDQQIAGEESGTRGGKGHVGRGKAIRRRGGDHVGTEMIVVTSAVTEVEIRSPVVEFLRSEKAGIRYEQGERIHGYEIEVWLGTNVVYCTRGDA